MPIEAPLNSSSSEGVSEQKTPTLEDNGEPKISSNPLNNGESSNTEGGVTHVHWAESVEFQDGANAKIHDETEQTNDNTNGKSHKHKSPLAHSFEETHFSKPTFCQWCNGFIWGISGKQGFQCTACKYAIHRRCLPLVPNKGCGDQLKEPTEVQLKRSRKAFAQELSADSSFGVFAPSNPTEESEFASQLEELILSDLKKKHTREFPKLFDLADLLPDVKDACAKVASDEFTNCFQSMNTRPWNWNIYLFPAWILGIFIRYFILFPLRVLCLLIGTCIVVTGLALTSFIKDPKRCKSVQLRIVQFYCNIFIASWSGVVRYHGPRPQKRPNQIFVANHTTVFDIVVLQQHFCFSIVGQKHPGIIGFCQNTVLKCLDCLWFDRKDSADRAKIAKLISQHVKDDTKLPLLLFPEGTCVNNEYCVMFKKGAFEIGATVWPIAIKYNKLFSDPFWNSRKQSFLRHLFLLMTSWALVADVWYLEPQTRQPGESAQDFAERVKATIAKKAGLINVPWDGYLKYFRPSPKFMEERQKLFASSLIARFSNHNLVELERRFLNSEADDEPVQLAGSSNGSNELKVAGGLMKRVKGNGEVGRQFFRATVS